MGSGFAFDVELRYGAGAFVCGEETALSTPWKDTGASRRLSRPFPAQRRIPRQTHTVNNVETLANIPPIILNGADWFSSIGTQHPKARKYSPWQGR